MFRVGLPREENISCKSLYYLSLFLCRCNFPISEFGKGLCDLQATPEAPAPAVASETPAMPDQMTMPSSDTAVS